MKNLNNIFTKSLNIKLFYTVTILFSTVTYSQEGLSKYKFDISKIPTIHNGNSYVTITGGLGSIEKLIFEGNLIPNFIIRENENSKLVGVFTPQIILRMYQENSLPVRTPSYMPHLTVYYQIWQNNSSDYITLFGRLAHHSNGQEGDFFIEDLIINRLHGSFSTNYFEAGIIGTSKNLLKNKAFMINSSFQYYPDSFCESKLLGIYSQYRMINQLIVFQHPEENNNKSYFSKFSINAEFNFLFGKYRDVPTFSFDRIQAKLTLFYHPSFFQDIGFFIQLYHGEDYYNIYFTEIRDMIRIGLMVEQLKF